MEKYFFLNNDIASYFFFSVDHDLATVKWQVLYGPTSPSIFILECVFFLLDLFVALVNAFINWIIVIS